MPVSSRNNADPRSAPPHVRPIVFGVFFDGQPEGVYGTPDRRHTRGRGEGVLQFGQRGRAAAMSAAKLRAWGVDRDAARAAPPHPSRAAVASTAAPTTRSRAANRSHRSNARSRKSYARISVHAGVPRSAQRVQGLSGAADQRNVRRQRRRSSTSACPRAGSARASPTATSAAARTPRHAAMRLTGRPARWPAPGVARPSEPAHANAAAAPAAERSLSFWRGVRP